MVEETRRVRSKARHGVSVPSSEYRLELAQRRTRGRFTGQPAVSTSTGHTLAPGRASNSTVAKAKLLGRLGEIKPREMAISLEVTPRTL